MADFQYNIEAFQQRGIKLLAASVDCREDAIETVSSLQLSFPVAFGLRAEDVSRLTGAFYQEEKRFLHASGFLLNRNGTVIVAAYSTGSIGRLTAADTLKLTDHLLSQEKQSSKQED